MNKLSTVTKKHTMMQQNKYSLKEIQKEHLEDQLK